MTLRLLVGTSARSVCLIMYVVACFDNAHARLLVRSLYQKRIMEIVKKHDMGTQLMMIIRRFVASCFLPFSVFLHLDWRKTRRVCAIRSYYDSKSLKLGQNQVMPMCFPEGKISKWQSSSGIDLSDPSFGGKKSPMDQLQVRTCTQTCLC